MNIRNFFDYLQCDFLDDIKDPDSDLRINISRLLPIILGTMGLVCCCTVVLGLPCSLASLIISINNIRRNEINETLFLNVTGCIIGIIGVFINSIGLILLVCFLIDVKMGKV